MTDDEAEPTPLEQVETTLDRAVLDLDEDQPEEASERVSRALDTLDDLPAIVRLYDNAIGGNEDALDEILARFNRYTNTHRLLAAVSPGDRTLFRCSECGTTVLADATGDVPVCQGFIQVGNRQVAVHAKTAMEAPGGKDLRDE